MICLPYHLSTTVSMMIIIPTLSDDVFDGRERELFMGKNPFIPVFRWILSTGVDLGITYAHCLEAWVNCYLTNLLTNFQNSSSQNT